MPLRHLTGGRHSCFGCAPQRVGVHTPGCFSERLIVLSPSGGVTNDRVMPHRDNLDLT